MGCSNKAFKQDHFLVFKPLTIFGPPNFSNPPKNRVNLTVCSGFFFTALAIAFGPQRQIKTPNLAKVSLHTETGWVSLLWQRGLCLFSVFLGTPAVRPKADQVPHYGSWILSVYHSIPAESKLLQKVPKSCSLEFHFICHSVPKKIQKGPLAGILSHTLSQKQLGMVEHLKNMPNCCCFIIAGQDFCNLKLWVPGVSFFLPIPNNDSTKRYRGFLHVFWCLVVRGLFGAEQPPHQQRLTNRPTAERFSRPQFFWGDDFSSCIMSPPPRPLKSFQLRFLKSQGFGNPWIEIQSFRVCKMVPSIWTILAHCLVDQKNQLMEATAALQPEFSWL